jgi:hypothetical protein
VEKKQKQGQQDEKRDSDEAGASPRQLASNEELCKKVMRNIIEVELNSKHMKPSPEELEAIATKMEHNLEVMEEVKQLVIEQGGDLCTVEDIIDATSQQLELTNQELQIAAKIQKRSRLAKIKLGVAGALGTIGFAVMGVPGALLALFSSFKLLRK